LKLQSSGGVHIVGRGDHDYEKPNKATKFHFLITSFDQRLSFSCFRFLREFQLINLSGKWKINKLVSAIAPKTLISCSKYLLEVRILTKTVGNLPNL